MNEKDTEREALIQRAEDACRPCGPCDSGLPMGCNCDPEPRAVIAGLLNLLADANARLAAVEALADDFDQVIGFRGAATAVRAALHPDPSEEPA